KDLSSAVVSSLTSFTSPTPAANQYVHLGHGLPLAVCSASTRIARNVPAGTFTSSGGGAVNRPRTRTSPREEFRVPFTSQGSPSFGGSLSTRMGCSSTPTRTADR